jgi:AraC-like DNA-binding protein
MDLFQLNIDGITLLGISFTAISLFLALFFSINRKFKNDGYFWLYTIILLIAFELGFKTFVHSRLFLDYPFLYSPGRYFNLLLYPAFLIFIWSITRSNPFPRNLRRYIIGMLLLYSIYLVGRWLFLDIETKINAMTLFYKDDRPGPFNYWGNTGTLLRGVIIPLLFLITIGYYFIIFKKKSTSKPDKRLLFLLTVVLTLYFLFTITSNYLYRLLYQNTGFSMIEWPIDIIFLSIVLLILCVVSLLVNMGSMLFPELKYAGSSLKETDYDALLNNITELLENEALYLEKSLTIKQVADRLSVNSKYISQVINSKEGMTFTHFINTYRIEVAKEKLLNNGAKILTLEAIGNECGFKSKSTFFGAFKKITGQTPAQFLRQDKDLV